MRPGSISTGPMPTPEHQKPDYPDNQGFNLVTGLYSERGSVPNEGTRRFRSPGDNGTGSEDRVLVIEADHGGE